MFVYQTPIESLKRLLINDKSRDFQIIVKIEYTQNQNDEIVIKKQKQIIINTTVNKARLLSRIIDEKYINDPKINQYVFNLGNMIQNENNKIQFEDVISIFKALIESDQKEVSISEEKKTLFNQILNILDTGYGDIEEMKDENIIECKYLNNDMFNGIISYLKQITNNNINGNNENLKLTGNENCAQYPLSNLLLYNEARKGFVYWPSNDGNDKNKAWIEFDFGQRRINVKSYSIQTIYNQTNIYHPKTWKFIGSNDHQNWEFIDIKENNDTLNGTSYSGHFECQQQGKFYRYIKYVQIDNWRLNGDLNKYYIGLSSIEFFGEISTS